MHGSQIWNASEMSRAERVFEIWELKNMILCLRRKMMWTDRYKELCEKLNGLWCKINKPVYDSDGGSLTIGNEITTYKFTYGYHPDWYEWELKLWKPKTKHRSDEEKGIWLWDGEGEWSSAPIEYYEYPPFDYSDYESDNGWGEYYEPSL